ncbi:1-acyl-sn-glycerol-3-phosphate acyltransferase [Campylobacter sp. RM9344]|uniref:1-acyl-sn-glycerol-3-phosphate acyltransferase n=1 Tax=Campylobacter californiensis TaxID=1032243 RepID=A0AAW3ZXB6_9BACT|nr:MULTISPECIES: lysophospholipid acyltransferase family protein [unclassified Campylobacter]MBE2984296.1 1-acyl-sn-glycerol-3-phosphate acyltransferase [Campylobacter sp. RM6883]MBE2985949.1 1-acyl-sn-glycerol-3-phosphate acyltransferase [Campylobacter sp. RM12919]MBE2988150.1 1-acyl-sn-glycerol-3-phosphate acyltransferase [Campylobacter sp. RM12920]MBE2994837.1 1-acyl-sn-glycerol-3-phosphate acyltransferase [Campylobacter sp. RM6913]MBE3029387.1 1-acyl-sn-glycerol-3-phosphate acyltransferase
MIFSRIKAFFYLLQFLLSVSVVVFLMWVFNESNRAIRRAWAKLQRICGLYSLELEGEFSDEANILLINHQSMLDIIVLEELHPKNLCWIAKAQIGKIPIIGKILSLPKMISVERESKHSLIKLLKDAEDRVKNGRVLAIFPEGTRSYSGKLLPFKGGAKIITEKLNLKVQPIVIIGTDILNVKKFSFKNGNIKVICLDTIDTSDKEWLENTRSKMQAVLDKERANLNA